MGENRVHAAETVLQFCAKLRSFGISHDQRRHRRRPRNVIAFKGFEKPFDIGAFETADVITIIDIAGRWPQHCQGLESFRFLDRRQNANHRTYGMPYEINRPGIEFRENFQHIQRVTLECAVPRPVEGRSIGKSGAHII